MDFEMKGITAEALLDAPTKGVGVMQSPRLMRRGELYVASLFNGLQAAALEGSYYIARTPTPGTGITLTSATGTAFSATNGIVGINNNDVKDDGRSIILDFITVILTAAGTAATSAYTVGQLDRLAKASGATTLSNFNVNGGLPADDAVADIHAGAITIATAETGNAPRYLGGQVHRKAAAPAFVIDDVITWAFGRESFGNDAIIAATAINVVLGMPPVVIPPGWTFNLLEWAVGRTAAQSAEVIVGYMVR